jgi:hypothetical protein
MDEDELRDCPKCEKPTLHRKGKCRQCATIRVIGRLKAARHFDPVRVLGTFLILALFAAFLYAVIAK